MRAQLRFYLTGLSAVVAGVFPAAAAAQQPKPAGIGAKIGGALANTGKWAGFFDTKDGKPRDFVQILGAYTQGILTLLGLIFMVLIIWGGFKWMTAAGNEEQVTKAKGVIRNATIGLALIVLARMITTLFINIVEPAVLP